MIPWTDDAADRDREANALLNDLQLLILRGLVDVEHEAADPRFAITKDGRAAIDDPEHPRS